MAELRRLESLDCEAKCGRKAEFEVVDEKGTSHGKYCAVCGGNLQRSLHQSEQVVTFEKAKKLGATGPVLTDGALARKFIAEQEKSKRETLQASANEANAVTAPTQKPIAAEPPKSGAETPKPSVVANK
jgi:hypothetical protein